MFLAIIKQKVCRISQLFCNFAEKNSRASPMKGTSLIIFINQSN